MKKSSNIAFVANVVEDVIDVYRDGLPVLGMWKQSIVGN